MEVKATSTVGTSDSREQLTSRTETKQKTQEKSKNTNQDLPQLESEQDFNETSSVEEVPDRSETWQNLAVVKFLAQLTVSMSSSSSTTRTK